jgi:hypothetical protein
MLRRWPSASIWQLPVAKTALALIARKLCKSAKKCLQPLIKRYRLNLCSHTPRMHILAARVIAYFGVTGFWLRFFTQTI